MIKKLGIILIACWCAAAAHSQEAAKPTVITSDKFQLDLASRKGLFLGNVRAEGNKFDLESSEATVFLSEKGNPTRFIARGDVKIHHGKRTATCRQAEYVMDEKKIILTGEPIVHEGNNRVTGNTIIIYPDTERMDVEGRSTVQIFP